MATQCKAKNSRGEPCGAPVVGGGDYCYWHDPALATQRAKARKLGGRNRRRVQSSGDGSEVSLQSPQDALALIERAANDSLALENSLARNRTLGYLAGVALKAQEIGELEERLAAIEERLEARHGQQQVAN